MESMKEICSRIELQKEVREIILAMEENRELFQREEEIRKLTEAEHWRKARAGSENSVLYDKGRCDILGEIPGTGDRRENL